MKAWFGKGGHGHPKFFIFLHTRRTLEHPFLNSWNHPCNGTWLTLLLQLHAPDNLVRRSTKGCHFQHHNLYLYTCMFISTLYNWFTHGGNRYYHQSCLKIQELHNISNALQLTHSEKDKARDAFDVRDLAKMNSNLPRVIVQRANLGSWWL